MRAKSILVAFVATALLLAACSRDDDGACPDESPTGDTLIVLTHDSFDATDEVIAAFEQQRSDLLPLTSDAD